MCVKFFSLFYRIPLWLLISALHPPELQGAEYLEKQKRESGKQTTTTKNHTVVMMGFSFVNVFKISVQVQGSAHLPSRLVLSVHSSLCHAVATWM